MFTSIHSATSFAKNNGSSNIPYNLIFFDYYDFKSYIFMIDSTSCYIWTDTYNVRFSFSSLGARLLPPKFTTPKYRFGIVL